MKTINDLILTFEESPADHLAKQPKFIQEQVLSRLSPEQLKELPYDWNFFARPKQRTPAGLWDIHLILAGRGFGKTRTGAQWVNEKATEYPECEIALVGATSGDVRKTMVEGEGGIIRVSNPKNKATYHPAKAIVKWANGSRAYLYSADEPDRLRGPNHHWAWCLVGETSVLMADNTEKPLSEIMVGEYVQTRKGPRKVLASSLTSRMSQVYQLRLMDGRVITGTSEHPVFVEGLGFVPISELSEGMNVCVTSALSTQDFADARVPYLSTQKIQSVERLDILRDVYNLTVEGENEFFANGVLTHNCDELASWRYDRDAWDMLQFTLRKGVNPQTIITTTPRPTKLIRELMQNSIPREDWEKSQTKREGRTVIVTRGSTYENRSNLAPSFFSTLIDQYEDSSIGRQEIYAEILEDIAGALWKREWFQYIKRREIPDMKRVIVAIDPAVTSGKKSNKTGICVAGKGVDNMYYIMHLKGYQVTPKSWAEEVVRLFNKHDANKVVAEVNNGGEMVEATLRQVNSDLPVKTIHASKGKRTRAENISTLYEQGRVYHVGSFPEAEEQMCLFTGDPTNNKEEDDLVDALTWALTELSDNVIRPGQPARAGGFRRESRVNLI